MIFVCLSHMAGALVRVSGGAPAYAHVQGIAMVATPSFLLLSGILLGDRLARRTGVDAFASKLMERGFFLLVIGHVLIAPAHIGVTSGWGEVARTLFVTDTIAIALLAGPPVARRTAPRTRAAVAALLLVVTWVIVITMPAQPHGSTAPLLDTMFGTLDTSRGWWSYHFPFVPWLAVYLAGSLIGEWLATSGASRDARRAAARLARLAAIAAVSFGALRLATRALASADRSQLAVMQFLGGPTFKRPPSPAYLLLFGGLSLLLVAGAHLLCTVRMAAPLVRRLAEVGRASFFVFVVQYYLFYIGVPAIGAAIRPWAIAYFTASLVLLARLAHLWDAADGNRLLRVPGWRRLQAARRAEPVSASAA